MDAPRSRAFAPARYADIALWVACIALASWAALSLRQDANWDLQNYHFYDPWAWVSGRIFDRDIAAAQLQTFHNPFADVPFYALVAANVDPRAITLWLALPTGIAAYLVVKIAWLLFGDLAPAQRTGATAAAIAIGLTGAMGRGQLGSTTGEWLVTAFVLAALWRMLRTHQGVGPRIGGFALLLCGLLAGLASGLKLTAATYALGLCIALFARRGPWMQNVRNAALYSSGVVAGIVIALGPWSWRLWTHFQNPLFPYGNQWFRSPWWDLHAVLPQRFGPRTFSDWLSFPFKLLAPPTGLVSELPYVDARLPVLFALALIGVGGAAIASLRRANAERPSQFATTAGQWRFVGVFFAASFVVWAIVHSILRYTIPLEILSGLLIVGLLGYLLRPRHAIVAITLSVAGFVTTTSSSDWGRVDFGPTWFDVRVPPVESNALVLLTVDAPMSYVLPFFPADARAVGIRNNINDPSRKNKLAANVAAVVREHHGPLYALSFPPGEGASDLLAHRLRRVPGGCADVRTNMPTRPIELCRLERTDEPPK